MRTSTLWIDAICLDQNDYAELSRQVPRMHDIYSLAWMSTLWLGVEDASSTRALKTFRYLGDQIVAEADTGLLFCSPNAVELEWYDPDHELPFTQDAWDGVRTLLERPWFHRLWVVQEIQPGAVVQCGHERVPVAAFTEAVYCLYSKARLPRGLRPHLEQATGTLARLPALCFTRLLYRAATFKACTDPRDKIYGLLGLAPRKFAAGVKVDYGEGNTAADVYAMTFLNHAEIAQRLEHFHNCFTGGEITANAPSWVPDWYSDVPGETYIRAQFATNTSRAHYTVSYRDRTRPGDKSRPDVLQVRGVRCGVVSQVSEPVPPRLDKREAIRRVRQWQPGNMDTSTYKPTGGSTRKAYAITLNCNILKEREPDWILSPTDVWVKQDFGDQALFGGDADAASPVHEAPHSNIRSDVADALQCCADRLFFRTHEGHMGLGPADTQAGDVIAIFLGCSTPLVLRPSDRGSDHFSVVGECFIHGLHDATVLLGPLPQPWVGIAAWVEGDRRCLRFLNAETQEVTREDPRLEPQDDWERVEHLVDGDAPTLYDYFRQKKTEELINYDPRLEPEKLEARGVQLDWFCLV
ncbi:hypothetical protein LTR36_009764 [Oleoguttula mirabilis]|uniref:Heterokaryon incompatibility domain-containing protein n=1 Tax=Oleoguttula mirabilis TaxID=1507867 RepID=A0AAV9J5I4_9PEZI|nr:hypothetical protein LTR36_009764 [Oleoguttula mirabilis]